jgi:hypothetical protein
MGEIELQRDFMYEAARALPHVRLFRRQVGLFRTEERTIKVAQKGMADLYGYVRGGRVVEIELKSRRGRLSEEQKNWQRWCKEWAIPHLVLEAWKNETSEQTVSRWIEELRECLVLF